MEITVLKKSGSAVELSAKGRLDAYWADHLAKSLEEVVRGGARAIRLNLSEVAYISSMGIRVLVDNYKKLAAIQGSFAIEDPSPQVSKVLSMAGLLNELLAPVSASASISEEPLAPVDRRAAEYAVATLDDAASFRCRAVGRPDLLARGAFPASACRPMLFPEASVAVGLGAFGNSFEDSRNRFGEFLAAAGSAVYQPTDGSNVADYIGSTEALVPEVQVLYALACEGAFSHMLRFSAKEEGGGSIALSELLADCLSIAGADRAAVVMVAESTGLLGAWLRKSPASGSREDDVFSHPSIRQWLSFTPDRVQPRALALVVGVVANAADGPMGAFLRPLGALHGHFHAAMFSYQPLQSGPLHLPDTVKSLFSSEKLHGVLHLLADDRGASGAGESEFVRGACWIGPLGDVVREEASA